jgi:hypothetical protein
MKKVEFVKLSWFGGEPIYWGWFHFNGGKCYHGYRFFALGIKVYL